MTISKIFKKEGFTLVETLVAISILLIAVVGPISIIGDALHRLYYARDEMIAISLAQEGIEAVRQYRDSNMLAGTPWDMSGITDVYYTVDVSDLLNQPTLTLADPCVGTCPDSGMPVFIGPSGFYQQTGGTPTQFSRIVRTNTGWVNDGVVFRELYVESTVTWKTGGQDGRVTVYADIFNWSP